VLQVIDHPGLIFFLPIGNDLVTRIEFADGLELSVDAGNRAILRVKFEKGSVLGDARKRAAKKGETPAAK